MKDFLFIKFLLGILLLELFLNFFFGIILFIQNYIYLIIMEIINTFVQQDITQYGLKERNLKYPSQ